MCGGTCEILREKSRVMGYTLVDGETIDEEFEPCPLCCPPDDTRQEAK